MVKLTYFIISQMIFIVYLIVYIIQSLNGINKLFRMQSVHGTKQFKIKGKVK